MKKWKYVGVQVWILLVYFEARSFLQAFSTFFYRCHAVCFLIHTHSFSLSLFFSLLYTFFEDVLSLNWWEISGKEQRLSGAAWKAAEELALWVSETQWGRYHKQTPAMQSTTIPPNQPAHLIAYSTHMPMNCSKNEKERCTYNTWPVRNITHLFRSTNSFSVKCFPKPFGNTSFTSNQVWKIWQAKWDLLLLSIKSQQLIFIHQSVMGYNEETGWNGHISMNTLFIILEESIGKSIFYQLGAI